MVRMILNPVSECLGGKMQFLVTDAMMTIASRISIEVIFFTFIQVFS